MAPGAWMIEGCWLHQIANLRSLPIAHAGVVTMSADPVIVPVRNCHGRFPILPLTMKLLLQAALVCGTLALSLPCSPLQAQESSKSTAPADQELSKLQGTWEGSEQGREDKGKVRMKVTG